MNKLQYVLILLTSIGLFSCETDIDVNAEYKDITAVYGVINPNDSVHYIKINKAFLGEGSALELAANPDNTNYAEDELQVTVGAYDENNSLQKSYAAVRTVNEVIKEDGIFDNSTNVLYRFDENNINRGYTYKVNIVNASLDKEVTAETRIVGNTVITKPSTGTKFQFWNGTVASGNELNKNFEALTGTDVGRMGMTLLFNYTEFYTNGDDSTSHSIRMKLQDIQATSPAGGEQLEPWVMEGLTFFDNISSSVPSPSSVSFFSHRRLENISLEFSVGGTELNTFMEVNAPSSSVNQDKPGYTNIDNGLGIFSSREKIYWISTINPVFQNQVNIQNSTISKLQSLNLGFCFGTTGIGFPVAPCQ